MDCQNCALLKQKEAEIEALERTQDVLFLLMDLGLYAVEAWAKENGLLEKNLDQHFPEGNDQIGMLLEQIGKSDKKPSLDRLVALLKLF